MPVNTIFTLQANKLALGESYRNEDAALAGNLVGRAIFVRA